MLNAVCSVAILAQARGPARARSRPRAAPRVVVSHGRAGAAAAAAAAGGGGGAAAGAVRARRRPSRRLPLEQVGAPVDLGAGEDR